MRVKITMLEDLIIAILKNPIGLGIIGLILFILVPEIRVYIVIIAVIVFIASIGKNGFYIYFAYSALSAFLSFIMSFFNELSSTYQQIYVAVNFMTFASIGNVIDLIFYVESSGWNEFQNLLAAIVFSLFAYGAYKVLE